MTPTSAPNTTPPANPTTEITQKHTHLDHSRILVNNQG